MIFINFIIVYKIKEASESEWSNQRQEDSISYKNKFCQENHEMPATINVSYLTIGPYHKMSATVRNKFRVSYLPQNVSYYQECQVIIPRNVRYISLPRYMKLSGIEMSYT